MFNWISVYKEFKEFNPNPLLALKATYQQIKYGNNWERVVFGATTNVRMAEASRYKWAQKHSEDTRVLVDLGCGSGYGSRFAKGIYFGVDLNATILNFAADQYKKAGTYFFCCSIQRFLKGISTKRFISKNSAIVAFEIIEHISDGKKLAQELRNTNAKKVFLSVPYNEIPGRWGEHHKLHGLTEADFPGYLSFWMNMSTGSIKSRKPAENKLKNTDYLLLLKYEATQ